MLRPLNDGVYDSGCCAFVLSHNVVRLHHGALMPINANEFVSTRMLAHIHYIIDVFQKDILDNDGSVATSATFGLFKSSLTGNTCMSSLDRDVDWLYDWSRVSARKCRFSVVRWLNIHPYRSFVPSHMYASVFAVLAPLFGAILIVAILVDDSCNCNVCCMKAMKGFFVIGAQVRRDQFPPCILHFCPFLQFLVSPDQFLIYFSS